MIYRRKVQNGRIVLDGNVQLPEGTLVRVEVVHDKRIAYLKVEWLHSFPDEPRWLYSELDADRNETRKVEGFPDGKLGYAALGKSSGGTRLSEVPIPPNAEIAADPQFRLVEILKFD